MKIIDRLNRDNEHKFLFNMLGFKFDLNVESLNYSRLFFLITRKHRMINHFLSYDHNLSLDNDFIERLNQFRINQRKRVFDQYILISELNDIIGDKELIFLKGLPLSQRLYNDFTFRDASDIDILIRPEDEKVIRARLQEMGYQYRRNSEHHWVCEKKDINIEIHRKLFSVYNGDEIERRIRNNCSGVNIEGSSFNTVGTNEIVEYLLINGAIHQWSRLSWVLDMQEILKQREGPLPNHPLWELYESVFIKQSLQGVNNAFIFKMLMSTDKQKISNRIQRALYFSRVMNYSTIASLYKSITRLV